MNKQVMHKYPTKDAMTPPNHLNEDGSRRAHVLSGDEESCWCDPDVLEWGEKPNGQMGWVKTKEGATL